MSLSARAQRVLKVLKESGPRPLTVVRGLAGEANLTRVVGELFISGVVVWQGSKRGRLLAARSR